MKKGGKTKPAAQPASGKRTFLTRTAERDAHGFIQPAEINKYNSSQTDLIGQHRYITYNLSLASVRMTLIQ